MPDTPRIDNLEVRVSKLEDIVSVLKTDVAEIKAILPHLATRADISQVISKIDDAVSGLLKDALRSVPARQVVVWTSVSAITALVGLALAMMHVI